MESERKFHNVVILAGTGDSKTVRMMDLATRHWKNHGLVVTIYNVGWKDNSTKLESKLAEIEKLVEKLAVKGEVSIIGCSAGGSAAFNLLLKRRDIIQKAISICGRLRTSKAWSPSSNKLHQSVLLFEGQEAQIPEELKRRMMTVSPQFGDQLVPSDTSHMEGAYNFKIPTAEHNFSISMALTLLKKPLIDFIKLSPGNTNS